MLPFGVMNVTIGLQTRVDRTHPSKKEEMTDGSKN